VIYTLIENCRMHGVKPLAYLKDVLERLPTTTDQEVERLTPLKRKRGTRTRRWCWINERVHTSFPAKSRFAESIPFVDRGGQFLVASGLPFHRQESMGITVQSPLDESGN